MNENNPDMSSVTRRGLLQMAALMMVARSLDRRAWGATGPPPSSPFGRRSTAAEVTHGLDLTGKTALVTGATSGLGYETLRVLALRGVHVLGTGRTLDKARIACASVEGRTTPLELELADFASVVACAESVQALAEPLDMLICNAGVMALPELEQVHGIEKQFTVNHLGHFLLVNRLLAQVQAAPQGRVVVVGSRAHRSAPPEGIQFDNLSGEQGYDPMTAYAQSKLANGLFAFELARRLDDTTVTSNVLHPGVIITNIVRHMPEWQQVAARWIARWFLKSVEQGAATQCYVATHPALAEISGRYFANCNPVEPSAQMRDEAMAAKLWDVSEQLTREFLV